MSEYRALRHPLAVIAAIGAAALLGGALAAAPPVAPRAAAIATIVVDSTSQGLGVAGCTLPVA